MKIRQRTLQLHCFADCQFIFVQQQAAQHRTCGLCLCKRTCMLRRLRFAEVISQAGDALLFGDPRWMTGLQARTQVT